MLFVTNLTWNSVTSRNGKTHALFWQHFVTLRSDLLSIFQFSLKGTVSCHYACTNFYFWTGWRKIKRWEESKRTLKNPFPSRLAEFNTTLKLQINDILFQLSFDLGEIWIFWPYFYCRWPEDQKMGSVLIPIEGLFLLLASIQAQIIVKGIRRNETATIKTVRKKPLRHWCDRGDLVEGSFAKQNVLQRHVSKLLNEPPYGRQNQTNRRYMFRKTSAMKS